MSQYVYSTFTNDDDSCQHIRSQRTTQFYYQAEPGYWMIITINVPSEKKEKPGGIEYIEYKSDEVHVKVFQQILRQSYQMFRLFNGKFVQHLCAAHKDKDESGMVEDINLLCSKLKVFYEKYWQTLDFQQFDILNVFQSIHFYPVNQLLFLRLHNFLKIIESTFSTIKSSIFLYNEQVVWSGINPSDLYSIYEYLNTEIFPQLTGNNTMARTYSLDSPQCGSFITGPKDKYEKCFSAPKVYVYNNNSSNNQSDGNDKCEIFNLIVYRASNATVCLFIAADNDDNKIDDNFYEELHTAVGPQLSQISSEIGESVNNSNDASSSSSVPQPKFLFFNQLNCEDYGNLYISRKNPKQCPLSTDVMNLLIDLYDNDSSSSTGGSMEETVIKTMNDYWIVKKQNNWRHFYVIINKSATLLEISEEAKKLFNEHTKDIYF